MNIKLAVNPNGNFQAIHNPDEVAQRRLALTEVFNAEIVPLPSKSTLNPDTAGWLCVSVWRLAILGTGDDRLHGGESLIQSDLYNWDNWLLQQKSDSGVQMMSVALREEYVHFDNTTFAKAQTKFQHFEKLQVAVGNFESFQSVVDSVSPDMSASHLLWVYKDGEPMFTAVHQGKNGNANSLAEELGDIINPQGEFMAHHWSAPTRPLSF